MSRLGQRIKTFTLEFSERAVCQRCAAAAVQAITAYKRVVVTDAGKQASPPHASAIWPAGTMFLVGTILVAPLRFRPTLIELRLTVSLALLVERAISGLTLLRNLYYLDTLRMFRIFYTVHAPIQLSCIIFESTTFRCQSRRN